MRACMACGCAVLISLAIYALTVFGSSLVHSADKQYTEREKLLYEELKVMAKHLDDKDLSDAALSDILNKIITWNNNHEEQIIIRRD